MYQIIFILGIIIQIELGPERKVSGQWAAGLNFNVSQGEFDEVLQEPQD